MEVERQNRALEAAKLEQDVIQKQAEAETEKKTAAEKAAEALKARQEAENRRVEADKAAKDAADAEDRRRTTVQRGGCASSGAAHCNIYSGSRGRHRLPPAPGRSRAHPAGFRKTFGHVRDAA